MKDAHDAFAFRRVRLIAGLQEKVVGGLLNLNKVRHFKNFANFTVVFPKTFLTEEGLSHDVSHLSFRAREQLSSGFDTAPFRNRGFGSMPGHRPEW